MWINNPNNPKKNYKIIKNFVEGVSDYDKKIIFIGCGVCLIAGDLKKLNKKEKNNE